MPVLRKLTIVFICCGALSCFGQDALAKLNKEEKVLVEQEKQIAKEIYEARVELLKKDPDLKKIHDKIMELHKELALMLDRKKEIRALADKMKKVRKSLNDLRDKKKALQSEDSEEEEE